MLDRTTQAPITKTLTLPNVAAWMAREAPETEYDYSDSVDCPVAMLLKSLGLDDVEVIPGKATFAGGSMAIPPEVDFILCGMPRTYGAALDRARALAQS